MKNSKKKFCIVTSSRADYGILSNFLKTLSNKHHVKLIVTGTHLSQKFGYTLREIKKDKIHIYKTVDIIPKGDSEHDISKTISKAITKFSKIFKNINVDTLILLGDRYEIFAAAVAASINRLKIAHIHGGETTSNALDESFRHSITIMSHIHFVAAKKYYDRVIQLGKDKENVHFVGSLSVANIRKISFKKLSYLNKELNIKKSKYKIFLIYHTETLNENYGLIGLKNILKNLKKVNNCEIFATLNNADTKYLKINKILKNFDRENKNFHLIDSLNYNKYLYLLKKCNFIIGNSSSGIIEAPSIGITTINVGDRQHGRLRAKSIIDTTEKYNDIKKAIKKGLKFKIKKIKNPYEKKNTARKILKVLEATANKKLIGSKFYDIKK